MTLREEARKQVLAYLARTGLTAGQFALRIGYARRSITQFMSSAQYGDSAGDETARNLIAYIGEHPPRAPRLPGTLWPTENVRIIDSMIARARRGLWGLVFGPPASQKSFVFKYRFAENCQKHLQPTMALIYASAQLTPPALMRRISIAFGVYALGGFDSLRNEVIETLKERTPKPVLIVDEAQHLAKQQVTLEIIREVGDEAEIGLIIAGHDSLKSTVFASNGALKEYWLSRITAERRLPGLQDEEVKGIVRREMGTQSEAMMGKIVKACSADYAGQHYLSPRRLDHILKELKEMKDSRAGSVDAAIRTAQQIEAA